MLQAESKVRLLECQDEITVEPSSKKLKSTDRACEKVSDYANQDIQEEMDAERTSNDLVPVYVSDNQGQHEMQKQEKMPTGVLGTLSEVLPENNLVLSLPIDAEIVQNVNPAFSSVNYAKVEDNKGRSITNNAGEDSNKNSNISSSLNRNASDEEFFTSKEFIGPIYKPAKSNEQDKSGSSNECGSSGVDQDELHEKKAKRKEAKKLHTVSSVVPKMDDELDQFYKEINQLENESLDTAFQEKEIETSQEQYSLPNFSQTSQEDHQHVLLGSPQPFHKNGQCFSGEQKTEKTSNEQQFLVEASGWKTENTFNGQVDSSVPEFRPAWQSAESFILPQGPLAPRVNHQSHFLVLNSPPQKTNALPSHSAELLHKNYNGYHGNINTNNHSLLFDQSANCEDIHTTQIFRNGNNDPSRLQNNYQNGLQRNGFCEAREECWNDPKADNTEGMQGFSSMQLPKERFRCSQKWLLILRGLPGSGKSTLSRTLLGQSCDGIVLSTDDYFRQQDGYTYNAAHLGDAHDWNQKRAKEAMEQGKSPVIIDNTNTQAWEMKPYVQVALEKGYRVEFYEPDTWWKFDPEELEKETILNNHRHLWTNGKQRKKQKRNKKMKTSHTEIMKQKLSRAAHHPITDDQDTSESEEDGLEEEDSKSLCTFSEGPEDPETVCEEQLNGNDENLKEDAVVSKEKFSVAACEFSTMSNSALKHELPTERDRSLLVDVKPCSTEMLTKNAFGDEETNQRHPENLCRRSLLKISSGKNSFQETESISEGYSMALLSTENKLESYQNTREADMKAKLLNGEEISQSYSSNIDNKVPDNNTEDKGALKAEENSSNAWACFSVNLPTEQLQLGFDTQVSLSSCSEDKLVCEQRPQKIKKPKQTLKNSPEELNCCWSTGELRKENHQVAITEEAGDTISSGSLASSAGEMHFDSLVEVRSTFRLHSGEGNVPRNCAAPVTSKRKGCRRIVNLAPKFNLPRQIAATSEGRKEVPGKSGVPKNSALKVEQKSFVRKDCGEEHELNCAFWEYPAPHSGTEATCSAPPLGADALLHDISYLHLGRSSMPKYSCRARVVSRMKGEKARTFKQQQGLDEKESEEVSSEVTNSQPDILSSVKVVSEYPEDSNLLASCGENVQEADDPEPAEASQLEDNKDVNMRWSFLGLPLSLGFAFQLVQLFGSPGLPVESLLPDDYIVPLDWKISKMIYLLWKTSVEEKQKTNALQKGNALADGTVSLEDLNENCQENHDSSEAHADREKFQGQTEENTDCQGAVFPQL
ncbi:uncharacterized protein [Heliangelus exortis]|uniref:uncharacterized protein isoform X5 n=1 Tax=Heliangelus exortis TaxID=472823 RepID=UPI003A91853F